MYSYEYKTPMSEPASKMDLKIYYCGTEECDGGNCWGPALKDHYKLHYIHSGKGLLRVGEKTYQLSAGQCFLICPDVITYFEADTDEPWTYYWVAFNGVNAKSYLSRAQLSLENPTITCHKDEEILKCSEDMFQGSQKSHSGDLRLLSSLYLFFSILLDERENENIKKSNFHNNYYISKSIEWLEANYSRNISVAEISQYIGLNRKYFSKIFKDEVGMSPQNFLIQLRFDRACELMKNQELSIGQISRSVGYEDQLLFSKVFKKFKGQSPISYRKNQME